MNLFLITFLFISQFILTENEFICGVKEEFYLVSVSQNAIQDTIEKIERINNQKIKDSVWKLIYENQDEFEVIYKDGRKEKIKIHKKCFARQKKGPEINFASPEIVEMIFEIPPGDEIKAETYYGKILEIKAEREKIRLSYKRFSKTPYEDIIFLMSAKKDENGNEQIRYYYSKLKIPGKIIFKGETTEPEAHGKIKIREREIEFVSDKKGKFSVSFYVFPGEEKFKVILKDRAGNKTEEEMEIPKYKFEEPKLELKTIMVGRKILLITEHEKEEIEKKIKITKDEFSEEYKISKPDESSLVLIPGFGRYSIFLEGKTLKTERKRIPYNISIYPEKNTVEATGEDKVKLKVEIEDITGDKIISDETLIKFHTSFGKIESKKEKTGQYFLFWAEKMPDEVQKYNVEINFETEFTSDENQKELIFLRAATQILLIPGKPSYIYTETQNKSFIKGDGKDEAIITLKIKDKVGNTVFIESATISILPSAGEIRVLEKNEKELKFAIRHESKLDDIIKINLEYGELSETLNIRVIGKKIGYDMNWELGAGTNFGKVALRTGPNLEMRYSTKILNFIFGLKLQTLASFGNIKIYSLLPGVSFGLQRKITPRFSIKAKNSFILNLSQIEFEKIKENTAIFGTEPSISFIFGKSFPIFSVSLSYLLNLIKMSETQFLEFSIKDLNFIFIQAGVSYIF
jgi:hypothetical protein